MPESSLSIWLDAPHSPFPSAEEPIRTDIAIIGGGIAGISTALFLAEAGYAPVLLEREHIGSGASGRNAGFLIAGSVEYYHRAIEFIGHERARRLWQLSLSSHNYIRRWIREFNIECEYEQSGSLVLAKTEAEFLEIGEAVLRLNDDGFEADLVTGEDLIQWGKPLERYLGGYYCSDDGAINPVKLVRGLARQAAVKGSQIFESTPVISFWESKDNTVMIQTPQSTIEAQMMLMCTNAYTPKIQDALGSKIIPVRGQMLATEPLPYELRVPCYANFGFDYFRQRPDGTLLIGGSRDHNPDNEAGYSESPSQEIQKALEQELLMLLHRKTLPEITHRWAGIMGFARDGLPILGKIPWTNNIYVAAGFTGHGMSLAPKIAEIASQLLIEGTHPDFSMFSIRRFLTS